MDRNTIRKEIVTLVSSIKNQSDILANEKYPSQLDLELFLHKVEKLYQKSIVFNHLSLFDGFEESETEVKPAIPESAPVNNETIQQTILSPPPILHMETTTPVISTETKPVIPGSPVDETIPETKPPKKEERAPEASPAKRSIADLKSSIGINDKFQFTNELFKGNMQEFNIAVEQLNASETLDSAMAYIGGLKRLYGWDEEHETVKRLLNLIERRYN